LYTRKDDESGNRVAALCIVILERKIAWGNIHRPCSNIIMKISKLIAILIFSFAGINAQEIPDGVRYKKATDAVNSETKTNLENALASESFPTDLFGDVMLLGPEVWKSLQHTSENLLLDTKPVLLVVSGVSAEGKTLRTDDERKAFWKLFRSKYPNLRDGKVRKGKADEIAYYWATIPFDIEEPFWVIDTGTDRFITNFSASGGKSRLLWIDRVDDLKALKP